MVSAPNVTGDGGELWVVISEAWKDEAGAAMGRTDVTGCVKP